MVDRGADERGEDRRERVDVAVLVQAAAKAAAAQLADVEREIVGAEPRRELLGHDELVGDGLTHREVPVPADLVDAVGDDVAGDRVHEPEHRTLDVGLEVGLGDAGLLEVQPVVVAAGGFGRITSLIVMPSGSPPIGGMYGTLSAATARNTSGRISAENQATGAPQSWPTTTAWRSPSAATVPTTSPTRWLMVYAPTSAGWLVVP